MKESGCPLNLRTIILEVGDWNDKKLSKNGKHCGGCIRVALTFLLEVFTNSTQYKNANIANLVLAVPLKVNQTKEVCNLEM